MKRILLLILFFSSIAFTSKAEEVSEPQSKPRPGYLNLNYTHSRLKVGNLTTNSDYGFALTVGRTFYLHPTPLAGMVRIGLDWTFFDFNFAQYKMGEYEDEISFIDKTKYRLLEIGMHIGPSVTVTPIRNLHISAYFRYAPSFASYFSDFGNESRVAVAYGSFFVTGASVSYKRISFGIEQRWGSAKFKVEPKSMDGGGPEDKIKTKTRTRGTRFYIGFRF